MGLQAIYALQRALAQLAGSTAILKEERSIRQPDSWLVERCWRTLAQTGHAEAALVLASLIAPRQPLAVPTALMILAEQAHTSLHISLFVRKRLSQHAFQLFQHTARTYPDLYLNNLLLTAAAAAIVELPALAFSCLERLDQIPDGWRTVLEAPELRPILARTFALTPPHPLTRHVIVSSLPRFGVEGAQFLNHLTTHLVEPTGEVTATGRSRMDLCLQAVAGFESGDVSVRRYATSILARAGRSDAVRRSVETLAAVIDAKSETALPARDADENILRHVVRSGANTDVDFQVYTLQEALCALPHALRGHADVRHLTERLVALAGRSDGWTATGAITALVETGCLEAAVDAVQGIAPADVAKSDAICLLVEGFLQQRGPEAADAQVRASWPWITQLEDGHLKRLTIRRLAELYIQHSLPQQGLALLTRRSRSGFLQRMFRSTPKEPEEWQLSDDRIRLLCVIQHPEALPDISEKSLINHLTTRAPSLLEGEALAVFYLRLLPVLVSAGRWHHVTGLLPGISQALRRIKGQKYAVRTREFTGHLAAALQAIPHENRTWLAEILRQWVMDLWNGSTQDGIWHTVYSIDGCLELVQAFEGDQPILAIGRFAQNANQDLAWGRTMDAAVQQAVETL